MIEPCEHRKDVFLSGPTQLKLDSSHLQLPCAPIPADDPTTAPTHSFPAASGSL